jgi:hypothetical protein|tara:strand:+ start:473 stop:2671 length:2199 start_codon:yes stop_codon:yes gene_type:complete
MSSTKRTIDIDINSNARDTQSEFDRLRKSIEESRKEVDKMSKAFGENSKEADRARQDLSDLTIAYDTLSLGATDLNATFEDVNDGLKPLTTRLGEAEDRLYELALAGDTTSREYQDLLKAVGQYRKVQLDTDMVVDSAATTIGQKLGGALGGATSGFAAVQGAMGLLGDESEALEKTLLKVQSALAIQQGFEGIRQAIPSFKQLGATATLAFNNMTTASKAFAVTGIGLLLAAVAVVMAKMDDLKAMFDDTSESQKALNDTTEAFATAQKNATVEVEKVRAAFNLAKEGVISKDEALKKYNDTLGGALGAATNLNEAEKIFNEKTPAYIQAVSLRAQANALFEKAAQIQADAIVEAMEVSDKQINQFLGVGGISGTLIGFADDMFGVLDDANKLVADGQRKTIEATANESAKTLNKLAQNLLQQSAELAKGNKINLEGTLNDTKNNAKELEDVENEILRKKFESLENGLAKAKALRALDLKEELEALDARNISTKQKTELLKFINQEFKEDIAAIDAFYADEEIKELEVQAATEIEITKQTNEEIENQIAESAIRRRNIDRTTKEEQIANAKAVADAQLSIAHDSLGAIGQLATAFAKDDEKNAKKAFKINKAVGIAQAIVSTAQGIMSQLAVPQDALTGANFVKAGIVAATGAAQIATIAKTEFKGGGGADAPSLDEGGGAAQAPSFNVVGDSGINQIASLQQTPVQAFVVSGEVTTSQALDRNRVENATL